MIRFTLRFDNTSTAAEVAAGHDLAGKRAIATGGNGGIGVETAVVLATQGAELILAVRSTANVVPAVERIVAAGGSTATAGA